jgi:hypothetical protein
MTQEEYFTLLKKRINDTCNTYLHSARNQAATPDRDRAIALKKQIANAQKIEDIIMALAFLEGEYQPRSLKGKIAKVILNILYPNENATLPLYADIFLNGFLNIPISHSDDSLIINVGPLELAILKNNIPSYDLLQKISAHNYSLSKSVFILSIRLSSDTIDIDSFLQQNLPEESLFNFINFCYQVQSLEIIDRRFEKYIIDSYINLSKNEFNLSKISTPQNKNLRKDLGIKFNKLLNESTMLKVIFSQKEIYNGVRVLSALFMHAGYSENEALQKIFYNFLINYRADKDKESRSILLSLFNTEKIYDLYTNKIFFSEFYKDVRNLPQVANFFVDLHKQLSENNFYLSKISILPNDAVRANLKMLSEHIDIFYEFFAEETTKNGLKFATAFFTGAGFSESLIIQEIFDKIWLGYCEEKTDKKREILLHLLTQEKIHDLPLTGEFYDEFYRDILKNPLNASGLFRTKHFNIVSTPNMERSDKANYAEALNVVTEKIIIDEDFFPKKQSEQETILEDLDNLQEILAEYQFVMEFGRSLVFKRINGEDFLVFKGRKDSENETTRELGDEHAKPDFLNAKTQQKTYGVYNIDLNLLIDRIPAECPLDTFFKLTEISEEQFPLPKLPMLLYRINNLSFFRFLHDENISNQSFHQASVNITDTVMTAHTEGGIAPISANMYHNEKISRPRIDLGVLHVFPNLTAQSDSVTIYPGKTEKYREGIAFTNFREGGDKDEEAGEIADGGDYVWMRDYLAPSSSLNSKYQRKIDSFALCRAASYFSGGKIFANLIAEDLYVLFLNGGVRGEKLSMGKSPAEAEAIWLDVAETTFANCVQAVCSLVPGTPKDYVERFLRSAVGDIKYLARPMQYFMTHAYIKDFMQQKIADGIFEPHIEVNSSQTFYSSDAWSEIFKEHIGFCSDGKTADLGAWGSGNPVTKVFELFAATIWLTYSLWKVEQDTVGRGNINKPLFFNSCNPYLKLFPTTVTAVAMPGEALQPPPRDVLVNNS